MPLDNNNVENRVRPVALGQANWISSGRLHAGKRSAAVMSLVPSPRLNVRDTYAYLSQIRDQIGRAREMLRSA